MGETRDLFKNIREGFTNSCEKKRSKRQRRKGKIYPFECRVSKNRKRDKKAFLSDQCKEIGGKIEWERIKISSRKLYIPRKHLCKDEHNKGQKWYRPNRSRRY